MLENVDIYALEQSRELLSLHDYQNDGTLSYCDISKLQELLSLTDNVISKVIIALQYKNQRVLKKICQYNDVQLMDIASTEFYATRNLFSKCFYYLTQFIKQPVHYTENISLIPKVLIINNDVQESPNSIRELFNKDNTDIDMYLDKLFMTFYHYYDYGHHIMNDADALTYSFSLLSATASVNEKVFYDFIKNIGVLYSSFVAYDRVQQLYKELNTYEMEKEYYIAEHPVYPSASWLNDPRRSNLKDLKTLLENNIDDAKDRRLKQIIQRHIDYLKTIRYLDPVIVGN